jgi:hypothetical protein
LLRALPDDAELNVDASGSKMTMAREGDRPTGQTSVQFMMVRQRKSRSSMSGARMR